MKKLIQNFANQLEEALAIADTATLSPPPDNIQNIALLGMGGSAFGGEVVKQYLYSQAKVPFEIFRDYKAPAYLSEKTLLLVSSYSGNTEETLSALESAWPSRPHTVCITSGGKLLQWAKENRQSYIKLPEGYPPRAAAGFSIVQQLAVLHRYNIIPDFRKGLEEAITLLANFNGHAELEAAATKIHGSWPILYTATDYKPVAIRWRQQIQENAKQNASFHLIPEMNHNELVGWKYPLHLIANTKVILLDGPAISPRNKYRMQLTKDIVEKAGAETISLAIRGNDFLAQLFYGIHMGDWLSYYLAERNQEDPTPVEVIDYLKSELAKQE